jgi:hypothetical protein
MASLVSAHALGNPQPAYRRHSMAYVLACLALNAQEDCDPVLRDVAEGREVDDYLSAHGLAPEPVRTAD